MKNMKRIVFFAVLLVLSMSLHRNAQAQDYKNAIGIRGSWNPGITYKHFIQETAALEAIVNPYRHGFNFALLYEKHAYAFGTKEFRWFYGLGGHVGAYNGNYYRDWFYDDWKNKYGPYHNYNRTFISLGVDGIIGLEYKITEIPFTLGIDVKPYINILYPDPNWGIWDAALSVRYYW